MTLKPDALKALAAEIAEQIAADRARARQLEAELSSIMGRIAVASEARAACLQLHAALANNGIDLPVTYSQDPKSAASQIAPSAGALAALGKAALDRKSNPAPREQTSPQVAEAQDAGDPAGLAAPQPDAPAAGAGPTHAPAVPKSGPWSQAEDARLLQLKRDGKTSAEAGRLLGRTSSAIDNRLLHLRRAEKAVRPRVMPSRPADPVAPRQDDWTLLEDLALVEGLTKGLPLDKVAAGIKRGLEEARGRFKFLIPHPSFEAQTAKIKDLRAAIEAAA